MDGNFGMLAGAGAMIMGDPLGQHRLGEPRITLNIEEVILHEQKLSNILEVSIISY